VKQKKFMIGAFVTALVLVLPPVTRAQMAVIDVASIVQLFQQIETMQQVLSNARNQLSQAQQALQSMTGTRGMQSLLPGVVRNYLPGDWQQLGGSIQNMSTTYPALAASVRSLVSGNAILSGAELSALSPSGQQRIQNVRTLVAMSQAMARNALANGGSRFADLQGLIGAIGSATDQKSILDLQARIEAEQGMLQNEQTKLQSLFQSLQAEEGAMRQQEQEQRVAGHGRFANRFQPTP